MAKYWTSKRHRWLLEDRQEQLHVFFEFANADLTQIESEPYKSSIHKFIDLIIPEYEKHFRKISDQEVFDNVCGLHKHLRARLKKTVDNTKMLVEMPLWSIHGSLKLTVEAKLNRFNERFRFPRMKPGDLLREIKRLIDLRIIEIIRDLDLKPIRFRQCPRCGNFFYQPTKKEKNYCSTRCGDAERLQAFRKEKKKLQKRLSDESDKKIIE